MKRSLIVPSILFLLLGLIYSPVLTHHPTLRYDDVEILEPLRAVHSLSDYAEAVRTYRIPDLQPVRDLTFWIELRLEDLAGFRDSQAVNLALWLAILWIVSIFLKSEAPYSKWNTWILFALAAHPLATSTVAWTSARKHLLAALFILLATLFARRGSLTRGKAAGIAGLYLCAVLSQPIHLLWPVWLFLFSKPRTRPDRDRRPLKALGAGLAAIMIAGGLLNFLYFRGQLFAAPAPFDIPKINEESLRNLAHRGMVLGRYGYQLLIPLQITALPYGLYQIATGLGAGALLIVAIVGARFRIFRDPTWFALALVPVTLMTVKLTHHAGMDTYIFLTLIALAIATAGFLWETPFSWVAKSFAWSAVALFAALSSFQVRVWTSDERLYAQAYRSEETLLATTGYAEVLLSDGRLGRISKVLSDLRQRDPGNRELPRLLGRYLFLRDSDSALKREAFLNNESPDPWYQYYFAAFDANEGHFGDAHERLVKAWEADPEKFRKAFRGQEKTLFSIWEKICAQAQAGACLKVDEIRESATP